MANRVVHFEIPADDPESSMAFYNTVFGWQFEHTEEGVYWLATTGDEAEYGINGGIMKRQHPQQPVANTIQVEDLDATKADIVSAGGEVVLDKMPIPNVGWLLYFRDPEGIISGIMQMDPDAK